MLIKICGYIQHICVYFYFSYRLNISFWCLTSVFTEAERGDAGVMEMDCWWEQHLQVNTVFNPKKKW